MIFAWSFVILQCRLYYLFFLFDRRMHFATDLAPLNVTSTLPFVAGQIICNSNSTASATTTNSTTTISTTAATGSTSPSPVHPSTAGTHSIIPFNTCAYNDDREYLNACTRDAQVKCL